METSAQTADKGSGLTLGGDGGVASGRGRMVGIVVALALTAVLAIAAWAAREGTVRLESDPPGAEVFVDGASLGVTPLTVTTRFSARSGLAEFRLTGHESARLSFTAEPGNNSNLIATLKAATGSMEVRSTPDGAEVYLDGVRKGLTPLVLESLSPAQVSVELRLANHKTWTQKVSVTAAERAAVNATIETLPSSLTLTSQPDHAVVWIDGVERGLTPLQVGDLAPGEHLFKVVMAGYEDWVKTAQLSPGANPELMASLQRPKLAAAPPQRPIAVMIDNHPDARPQSGLSSADIVYEAIAEGGVTRYMGIFSSRPADAVGPVRSARHYFVHWADEFNAMYVHCGGYPEAYAAIESTGIADFDDLKGSPGFWRSDDRPVPHNLYASTEDLRAAAAARGYKTDNGTYGGLLLSASDKTIEGPAASAIDIDYPHGYQVQWRYDEASNSYSRLHNGIAQLDAANGQQLRGSSIVVMYAKNWFIGRDDQQDMTQVGTGEAHFFIGGKTVEGTWTREALDKPTMFWTDSGDRVEFNANGTIWLQVVPLGTEVEAR